VSLSLAENRLFLRYISLKKSTADLIEIMVLVKDQFNDNPDKYRINKYRNNALNEIAHRRNRKIKGSNLLLSLANFYCITMLCPDH